MQSQQKSPLTNGQPAPLLSSEAAQPVQGEPESQRLADAAQKNNGFIIVNSFLDSINRIEELLEKETALLRSDSLIPFDELNRKKSYGLLELRHAIEALKSAGCRPLGFDPSPALIRLRALLQENRELLISHLHAAGTITTVIARAIQDYESDGTYTVHMARKAGAK